MPALLVVQQHELPADRAAHCDRLVAQLLDAMRDAAAAPQLCEWFRSPSGAQCTLLERHSGTAELVRHRARNERLYSELLECAPGKVTILAAGPDPALADAAVRMHAGIGGTWVCGADAPAVAAGAGRTRYAAFALAHLKFAPACWPWLEGQARIQSEAPGCAGDPALSRHWFVREGLRDAFVFEELSAPTWAQLEACAGARLVAGAGPAEPATEAAGAGPAAAARHAIERRVRLYGNVPRELAAGLQTIADAAYCGARIAGLR